MLCRCGRGLAQDLGLPTQTQVHVRMKSYAPQLPKEAVLVNLKKRVITVKFGAEPEATRASMDIDKWGALWHHPKVP